MSTDEVAPQCQSCGEPIRGQQVTVPTPGDVNGELEYHRKCVDVDYPENESTENVGVFATEYLDWYQNNGEEPQMQDLFQALIDHPDGNVEEMPDVMVSMYGTFKPRDRMSFWELLRNKDVRIDMEKNMTNPFLLAVFFGCALEREYPAFSELDPTWDPDDD